MGYYERMYSFIFHAYRINILLTFTLLIILR